jgi:HKD family nuclease
MIINILGQGYEASSENSVGNYLIKFLKEYKFNSFTAISAFASESGINGIGKHINSARTHLKNINIILGIDKQGTSKEALEALLKLKINSYIYHQRTNPIFHPKIYLFEGDDNSELIIGSSNMTSQGLFSNVEASILVSLNKSQTEDVKLIQQLKSYFKGIFDFTDPNLQKLTTKLIKQVIEKKLVISEEERMNIYDKSEEREKKATEIFLSKIFPKKAVAKIPAEFRSKRKPKELQPISESVLLENKYELGKLVWTRKSLPSSSVQASGEGTNPTGGLRLVQDKFIVNDEKIDQTTYFRNDLFRKYKWTEKRKFPFVEVAKIPFEITIKGKNIGKHNLEVRHKPTGEAGQHNYTTSISWGELGEIIQNANLTGSRLDLYEPKGNSKTFQIIIR